MTDCVKEDFRGDFQTLNLWESLHFFRNTLDRLSIDSGKMHIRKPRHNKFYVEESREFDDVLSSWHVENNLEIYIKVSVDIAYWMLTRSTFDLLLNPRNSRRCLFVCAMQFTGAHGLQASGSDLLRRGHASFSTMAHWCKLTSLFQWNYKWFLIRYAFALIN